MGSQGVVETISTQVTIDTEFDNPILEESLADKLAQQIVFSVNELLGGLMRDGLSDDGVDAYTIDEEIVDIEIIDSEEDEGSEQHQSPNTDPFLLRTQPFGLPPPPVKILVDTSSSLPVEEPLKVLSRNPELLPEVVAPQQPLEFNRLNQGIVAF